MLPALGVCNMRRTIPFVLTLALCLAPINASARGFFQELGDFFFDPLKLRSSSENVYRSVNVATAALSDLRGRFDADVQNWLRQISVIIDDANSGVADRIAQAEQAALRLEQQLVSDMSLLLRDAECAAERFANEAVQRALISAINTVAEAGITIDLPISEITLNIEKLKDFENDELYRAYKKAKLEELNLQLSNEPENTDPNVIISAYQNISERAYSVHCHYVRSGGAVRFLEDHYEYRARLRFWTSGFIKVPT